MTNKLGALLLAENTSLQLGGEAALAVHWFRELSRQGVSVRLQCLARSRHGLYRLFPADKDHLVFVEDSWLQAGLWQLGSLLPQAVALFTTGLCIRLLTQRRQRRMARWAIRDYGINFVHLTTPVSPLEPALLRQFGVSVIISWLNGGTSYPPGFDCQERWRVRAFTKAGCASAVPANASLHGKSEAACLLAANERKRGVLLGVSRVGCAGSLLAKERRGHAVVAHHAQPYGCNFRTGACEAAVRRPAGGLERRRPIAARLCSSRSTQCSAVDAVGRNQWAHAATLTDAGAPPGHLGYL